MKDEGASVQGLPIEDLQQRVQGHEDRMQEIVQTHRRDESGGQQYYEEIIWRSIQMLHYYDALLVKLPLDRTIYDAAFSRAASIGLTERGIVYLEGIIHHFPKSYDIGNVLRFLGASQTDLAQQFDRHEMPKRSQHFLELAEASLRQSIETDNTALGHMLLAELLMRLDRDEEAQAEFQSARSLTSNRDEEAQIEFDLASIAMKQEKFDEAVSHFKQVAEINPNYDGIWLNIGVAYRRQKNYAQAEAYLKRALEAQPHDLAAYVELVNIYIFTRQTEKAYETVEQGLRYYPESAHLHALLATVYMDREDRRRAQAELEKAERINPDLDIVQAVRDMFNTNTRRKGEGCPCWEGGSSWHAKKIPLRLFRRRMPRKSSACLGNSTKSPITCIPVQAKKRQKPPWPM